MNIREFAKPVTSRSLNESLAARFGQRIKLENFTLEQLQDARNKLRTRLSQVETNESFDSVHNETYQKSKLMLDILNAALSERGHVEEDIAIRRLKEGEEDKAELVMAAKDMVDRLTGWMEDVAEMQTESMLELADAVRDELGQEASEAFVGLVKPALESLYQAMETTRSSLTNGVGQLTGEGTMPTAMPGDDAGMGAGDDLGMGAGDELGPDLDGEITPDSSVDDDFGAAEPATGGEEPADRAKRESKDYSGKVANTVIKKLRTKESINPARLASLLSKKK